MNRAWERLRSAFVSLPARATLLLLSFVSIGILVMGGLGYIKLDEATEENAAIRIDRAARAIAAHAFAGTFTVERSPEGAPVAIRLAPGLDAESLQVSPGFDAMVEEIAATNQGSANVFRLEPETGLFERFATTLRRPDGTLARNASLGESHAAYTSLIAGQPFTGQVQVLERYRLAYLTPILTADGSVAGALAVDVGWVDDLQRARTELREEIGVSAALILLFLTLVGALLLDRAFRPLRTIGAFADRIAAGEVRDDVPYRGRRDEIGTLASGMARVVAMQSRLENLAYYDQLTGAFNRLRFERALKAILGESDGPATPAALLVVDLDQFRSVNDALGHAAGDVLVARVADAIRRELQPGETLARIGGDEFAVISTARITPAALSGLAEAILSVLSQPFHMPQGEIRTGGSIGIAILPQDGATAEDAIRNVGLAVHQAKHEGRGRYRFFAGEMYDHAQKRLAIARQLRGAIGARELTVHFQPQFRASDFALHGVEALARWPHPTRGFIPPGEFIPIAEEFDLMVELGALILDETCRIARQWLDAGFAFNQVSVNVSAVQIRQADFEAVVRRTLDRWSVPAEYVCLEVTESVFVHHGEIRVLETIERLRALGVSLSLDDFGTGYSSLGYLNKLPFRQIKIDRGFVANVDRDPRKESLLRGVVALGRGLGLEIVGEGAETAAEVGILRAVGCDLIQGYYFCRPLPAARIPLEADRVRRMRVGTGQADGEAAPGDGPSREAAALR